MQKNSFHAILEGLALILCRLILPALTILFALILPNVMPRHLLVDSVIFDWVVRLALTAYFCVQYWNLPRLFQSKPGRWLSIDAAVLRDPLSLRGYYVFMAVGYGFFTALFTFLAFSAFLPDLSSFRLLAASLNGLIIILAFVLRYRAFRELAANQLQ